MARINVDKFAFAIITKDEIGAGNLIYETPEIIDGIQAIDVKIKSDTAQNYEQGILTNQDITLTDVEVSVDLGHFSNAQYAKLLGHHIANEGGAYAESTDVAPYVAILVKYTLAGNKHGYKSLYKGIFQDPDDSIKQKEGKISYQNHTITATFQPLKNNSMWQYMVEEGDADCPATIDTDFFTSVIVPTEKVGA